MPTVIGFAEVNGDAILRWTPLIVTVLNLMVMPLVIIAINAQIDGRIARHNDNLYAHPALSDLKKLEAKIENLAKAVRHLELAITKLTGHGFNISVGEE